MANGDLCPADGRAEQLAHIERLLEEYRATKDLHFLRRAVELLDQVEAEHKAHAEMNRLRLH